MEIALLGSIILWPVNWTPVGWLPCLGQTLTISQNQELYAVIGTQYGGDGRTTFCLPDLRGRIPLGMGQADGLSNYTIGSTGGTERVSLSTEEMPAHSHDTKLQVASPLQRGEVSIEAAKHYPADGGSYATHANNTMAADTVIINQTGQGIAHENRQPYLTLNYIICTEGIFPSRP